MKTLLTVTLVLLFTGCGAGTYFTWSAARQLKVGMTKADVTALLGSPYMVRTVSDAEGVREIWVWSYAVGFGGSRALSVTFVGDNVTVVPAIPDSFSD